MSNELLDVVMWMNSSLPQTRWPGVPKRSRSSRPAVSRLAVWSSIVAAPSARASASLMAMLLPEVIALVEKSFARSRVTLFAPATTVVSPSTETAP